MSHGGRPVSASAAVAGGGDLQLRGDRPLAAGANLCDASGLNPGRIHAVLLQVLCDRLRTLGGQDLRGGVAARSLHRVPPPAHRV